MAQNEEKIFIKTKRVVATSEFAVGGKISIDQEKPLLKVLSVSAIVDTTSGEKVDTDYHMMGKTQVNVVYITTDGKLDSASGTLEWNNQIKVSGEDIFATTKVVECKTEYATEAEISVSILHNSLAYATFEEELAPVVTAGKDYIIDSKQYVFNNLFGSGEGKFVVADTAQISAEAQKVLSSSAQVVISNVYAGIDQVTIEGALNLKAQYLTENGVGTYSKTTDFKQELACIGALPGDMVSASAEVVSLTTNIESGDAPSLVTATNIRAVVNNYKQVSVSLPTDMFSISKELNLTNNCVEVSTFAGYKVFTDTSLGSSNIEGGGVDEVMCAINPQIAISRIVIDGGKIITEGVLSCDLIYRNNEAESVLADKISQPFISKIDTDTNGEISLDSATCEVANIKIHSAKEVEILYNISLGATILEDKYIQYVAEVEEASDKAENPSAITIYVTKPNETLFEVARTLSVDPQTITEQNDLAGDIFTGGQRVFVYKPLVAEF